jgi:hypothetical protein
MDHTWFVAGLSLLLIVIIAAPLSFLVLSLWDEWSALVILLYAFLFMGGGWLLMLSRSFIGNVITIGIFLGLVADSRALEDIAAVALRCLDQ